LLLVDATLALRKGAKLVCGSESIHSVLVLRVKTVLPVQLLGLLRHALRFVVNDAVDQHEHETSREVDWRSDKSRLGRNALAERLWDWMVVRNMDPHANRSAFLAANESLEAHATARTLNALAVPPSVPAWEVADVETLNQDLHGTWIVWVVRFADEFQVDVVKLDRLRTAAAGDANKLALAIWLAGDLDACAPVPRAWVGLGITRLVEDRIDGFLRAVSTK
jgi:hypothetical protein